MRTDAEILKRIREVDSEDLLGFEVSYLMEFLPYKLLPKKAQEKIDPTEWPETCRSAECIRERMVDYMPFAWEKANDERGISAYRSLCHYKTWLWMLGEDWGNITVGYTDYGKPTLRRLCEFLGLDSARLEAGERYI